MKTSLLLGVALAASANAAVIEARQRPRPTSTKPGIPDGETPLLFGTGFDDNFLKDEINSLVYIVQ